VGSATFRVSDHGAVSMLLLTTPPMTRQVTDEVRYPGKNVTRPHSAAATATAATFAAGTHARDLTPSPMRTHRETSAIPMAL
jgi:hypothetical protein